MKKRKFKKVRDETGETGPFTVFIIHGRSNDWKQVKAFIVNELNYKSKVIVEEYTGDTIITKIRNNMWYECDCAVAILSADDVLADSKRNARPNVLFEIGYCMGFFDYRYWEDDEIEPIILIKEDITQVPSDFAGIEYISYSRTEGSDGIAEAFPSLKMGLKRIYAQVAEYFEE